MVESTFATGIPKCTSSQVKVQIGAGMTPFSLSLKVLHSVDTLATALLTTQDWVSMA